MSASSLHPLHPPGDGFIHPPYPPSGDPAPPGRDSESAIFPSKQPFQASSLLSAKLRCYFSGLPSHFEADFSEFSALPGHSKHAFRSTGSTFFTFSQFSLHIASSPSLRASFCRFSGPLGTSRQAPGSHFSGQKGRGRNNAPPLFDVHVSKFASDLQNGTPQAPK